MVPLAERRQAMKFGGADFVLAALIGLSTLIGLFRGLFKEAFSLIIWALSLVLAYLFAPSVQPTLARTVGSDAVAYPLALVAIFIVCLIVGALMQRMGATLIDNTGLSGLDRLLGMVFGAARGAIVAVVLLIALRPFFATATWWQESVAISLLLSLEHVVLSGLQNVAGHVSGFFH